MKKKIILLIIVMLLSTTFTAQAQGEDNPTAPEKPIKLIFIHHSTGENWLRDDYGGLGQALAENNYFVSDTNYGWGPDAIGDRTDIVNWPEWFRSAQTDQIMTAVLSESGQNSSYTRTFQDPGGENEIVLFKSCFPNSQIEGNPGDSATPGDGLTVSNAKYIYNDLLNFFSSRPDKLFVVITAPPVQDSTYAANAKAFNTWLTQDWLRENNYPYSNVAVFDFFNVLTHRDNHHRFRNGQIEYVNSHGDGTSNYPSARDDDHPNETGSRKATDEFIVLLNIFFHRWKATTGGLESLPTPKVELHLEETPEVPEVGSEDRGSLFEAGIVDDFEGGAPASSMGWLSNRDEATTTEIQCALEGGTVHAGAGALHISFTVQAESWSTCALGFDQTLSVADTGGIKFYIHAVQPGNLFDVLVYGGSPENQPTYVKTLETTQGMIEGWELIQVPWNELLRVDWEENAGTPFSPAQFTGIAFGFNAGSEGVASGEVWIDDIALIPSEATSTLEALIQPTEEPASEDQEQAAPTEPIAEKRRTLPCPGSLAVGFLAVLTVFGLRKKKSR